MSKPIPTLNRFKSWYAEKVEHRSLEEKREMLAAMKALDDPTVHDINDEMIAYVEEQINNEG